VLNSRFVYLLVSIFLLVLLGPALRIIFPSVSSEVVGAVFFAVFVVMLLLAVFAVSDRPRITRWAWRLAVPAIVINGINFFTDSHAIQEAKLLMSIVFLTFVVIVILQFLFRVRHISGNVICASLCAYLLLAVLWALAYAALDRASTLDNPHFSKALIDSDSLAIYFSFVTITTLGYGDIVPLSEMARALVVVEAVAGQLFLAVLVARFVGMHIAQAGREPEQ
jgi:voltage-gated potassium channel Kch